MSEAALYRATPNRSVKVTTDCALFWSDIFLELFINVTPNKLNFLYDFKFFYL